MTLDIVVVTLGAVVGFSVLGGASTVRQLQKGQLRLSVCQTGSAPGLHRQLGTSPQSDVST